MPILPFKTRIRRAVLERLGEIQAGATYWCTPHVEQGDIRGIGVYADDDRGGRDYLDDGPVVGIRREPGSEIVPMTHDSEPSDLDLGLPAGYGGDYRFAIVGYARAGGDLSASDWIDALQQDVVVALMEDPKLGGLVDDLRPDGTDDNDAGVYAAEHEAEFAQVWLARKFVA